MPNEEWRTGTVGSYDPVTKERVTNTFTYQPAPPPSPMDILGKIASQAYSTLPIEDAEKATAAAIQFQGMRGYQQALKNGDPASKALAQWGPLMFYQKPQTIAPMIKATTPAAMTPYQQAQIELAKQRAGAPNLRNVGGNLVKVTPEGKVETLFASPESTKAPYVSPAAREKVKMLADDIKKMREEAPELKPPGKAFGFIPTKGNQAEVDEYNKKLAEREAEMARIGGGIPGVETAPAPVPTATVTTTSKTAAGQSAAKKRYTVKGGKLVPIE